MVHAVILDIMASAVRTLCRVVTGVSVTALRARAPPILHRWRYLTAASYPALWKIKSSRLQPQSVLPRRGYAEQLTSQELEQRVLQVLKLFDKIDPTKVTPEAHFINDYGLDSLDVVEIVMAFENEFGIEIDDEQAEKIFTANDAIAFLSKELGVH